MTRELQDLISDLWFVIGNPEYLDAYNRMTLSQRVSDALDIDTEWELAA